MVKVGEHWEPPQARPLLLTVHALADRLDIPLDRAYGVSYSLGRICYGPSHTHIRVLTARVDALEAMVGSGMLLGQAAEVIRAEGAGVYTRLTTPERADLSWGRVTRRRRRRRW